MKREITRLREGGARDQIPERSLPEQPAGCVRSERYSDGSRVSDKGLPHREHELVRIRKIMLRCWDSLGDKDRQV